MTYTILIPIVTFIGGVLAGYFVGWINGSCFGYNNGERVGLVKGELKALQDAIKQLDHPK